MHRNLALGEQEKNQNSIKWSELKRESKLTQQACYQTVLLTNKPTMIFQSNKKKYMTIYCQGPQLTDQTIEGFQRFFLTEIKKRTWLLRISACGLGCLCIFCVFRKT